MQDHYDILELDRGCSQSDIKDAYRRLAKKYHPDKNKKKGDDELKEIQDRYMKIHKAYEVLSDPTLREEYDRSGISAGKGDTIIDPLEAMMRIMEEKNQTGVPDVIVPIDTSLSDLYRGFTQEAEFIRISPCDKCRAHGTRNKKKADCANCKGRGAVLENIEGGEMGYAYKESACDVCRGTGLDPDVKRCKKCNGDKYERETIECDVEVPEGAYEGYFIKFEGEGNFIPKENRVEPDQERTDVLFVIADVDYTPIYDKKRNLTGPLYKRGIVVKELKRADRADVMIDLKLSFEESICGITKKILHLDGSIIEVEVDEPVVNNDIIVLEGKGMPVCPDEVDNRKAKNLDPEFGDLFIRLGVSRPKLDNSTKRRLWQVLTNTSYQKREKLDFPEPYIFLDTMIEDQNENINSDTDSDTDSDTGSEFSY